jgi:hypothetical protein
MAKGSPLLVEVPHTRIRSRQYASLRPICFDGIPKTLSSFSGQGLAYQKDSARRQACSTP